MFLKIGSNYAISLLVTDANGERVTTDSPFAVIRDITTSKYWNGITWSDTEQQIFLDHVANGVYKYDFTPTEVGTFEIKTSSAVYSISKTETIDVYDGEFVTYQWKVGTEFYLNYDGNELTKQPMVQIYKESDRAYWNGFEWQAGITSINMQLLESNVATYSILLSDVGNYFFQIIDGENPVVMIAVEAVMDSDNIVPVIATSGSLLSPDGTDCVIYGDNNTPMSGVKVSVYDVTTKTLVGQTASDASGNWSIAIRPGRYLFMFEKEGYISVTITREVM